jgi:hypothetical protein
MSPGASQAEKAAALLVLARSGSGSGVAPERAVALPPEDFRSPRNEIAAEQNDLLRALQEKGATMTCPACGRRDWASSGRTELAESPRTEVYLLSCRGCGYVRMHDLDFLLPGNS